MTNKEIWKDIKGYDGKYQISNYGRIKSVNYRNTFESKILKLHKINTGYLTCHLRNKGMQKQHLIHRLVAEAFLENDSNYPEVNHKNEDKNDNRVENLEWCTSKYNCNYGLHIENIKNTYINKGYTKKLKVYLENGEYLEKYNSISECCKSLNIYPSAISNCLKNKSSYKGLIFKEVINEGN